MTETQKQAPGQPGIPPRWTSSAKSGVGTSLNLTSRVWFTLSHGIFDEVYYPRLDQACTRDMGMIVTDGEDFFSEEKRHTEQKIEYLAQGVPAFRLTNTCKEGRYRITKEVLTDPQRDVVLQRTHFEALQGELGDYHLYVLLAPHLGDQGTDNTAWIGAYKGVPMLFAERDGVSLALASSAPWLNRSAGFAGASDGWQDLRQHKQMTWLYEHAENGNVALTGEVDLQTSGGDFLLALGFGLNPAEAGQRVLASLLHGFKAARAAYLRAWRNWQKKILPLEVKGAGEAKPGIYPVSAAVLRIHEAKRFPGGLIASLSIPWGFAKGDDDLGGYHLVWPRDLAESAGGLLAAGAKDDARRVLEYLQVTQEADGHWPQNMWLDGRTYWSGIQMDETAFPILLIDLARQEQVLSGHGFSRFWPMARKAAAFIVQNGPVTQQDRWEEDPGYSPFTLAVEIAALLAAAEMAEINQEPETAKYLRETADAWNASIERWVYVSSTDLANQVGVDGYYVRIAPPEQAEAGSVNQGFVPIKNRPPGENQEPASYLVSPDALALVRFGLRSPDDPRILDTIKVIDEMLKVDTPNGAAWHRYNQDGYGEHEDGSPFDGTGIGRAWPLLTGERAHYELAAGRKEAALRLMQALEAYSNDGCLLPEQIWDAEDIPERELFRGRPSGSAMPLVWAHAEYVKLRRSLHDGRVFDMPAQTVERYLENQTGSPLIVWRFNQKCQSLPQGKTLRIETRNPAVVHWTADNWANQHEAQTADTGLGVHYVDLPVDQVSSGETLTFTFFWPGEDRWEGKDFNIAVAKAE